ncbi:MAG: SDR family NAD(P)-dependent oxidoreductase [Alphaproteobacteria bacterium]
MQRRSVVITGGASGIGFDVAALLSQRGWHIYLIDRNAEALENACKALSIDMSQGINCSVTDEDQVNDSVATAARSGALSAVVNSAGIALDRPAVDTSVDEFRRIVDINLTGTFVVARAAARHWMATGSTGAIVNISSVSGIVGSKGRSAYGASKGGVNLLTYVLATELGQHGIRVNAVAPGAIDTPLSRAVHTPDVRAQWDIRIPQRRYGTTREVASTVAYLLSDEASYINGQVIAVDGGFSHAGLTQRD